MLVTGCKIANALKLGNNPQLLGCHETSSDPQHFSRTCFTFQHPTLHDRTILIHRHITIVQQPNKLCKDLVIDRQVAEQVLNSPCRTDDLTTGCFPFRKSVQSQAWLYREHGDVLGTSPNWCKKLDKIVFLPDLPRARLSGTTNLPHGMKSWYWCGERFQGKTLNAGKDSKGKNRTGTCLVRQCMFPSHPSRSQLMLQH